MSTKHVIEILVNELSCVITAEEGKCDGNCECCILAKDSQEIKLAYRSAIRSLEMLCMLEDDGK